jgi:hypothetical protein
VRHDAGGNAILLEPSAFAARLSCQEKSTDIMTWLVGIGVIILTALAGSPWLLAHRAQRRWRIRNVKMQRNRLRMR